ncbi:acid protease [Lichtheimia hyalospora FSU 10163]|nr:acid protease [Lichtheimia hyalospora FSU 10163]
MLALWHPTNAVSIQDFLFSPSNVGDMLPKIPLNFLGGIPVAEFSVGTPPQNFTGIFDTESPFTWMMSTECTSDGCANVPIKDKFNHSASSTNMQLPMELDWDYPDGTHIKFTPELDTVTLAGTIPFPRHVVGDAMKVTYPEGYMPVANARIGAGGYRDDLLDLDPTKGKGLPTSPGGAPGAGAGVTKPPFRRAASDDHFSTGRLMSGSGGFRKRAPNAETEFAWVLGSDPSMYTGQLYPLDLTHNLAADGSPFWKVPLKGISLSHSHSKEQFFGFNSNSDNEKEDGIASVVSSTPYIKVPSDMADAINKAIGATEKDPNTGVYTLGCDARHNAPSLVVHFSQGVDAKIPAQQYINQYEHVPAGKHTHGCFSTIVPGNDDRTVTLGGPFFRSFYIEYSFLEQKIFVAESIAHIGAVYPSNDGAHHPDTPATSNQLPPAQP